MKLLATMLIGVIGLISGLLFLTGCEVSSANDKIEINPDSARLNKNESVVLTANGGYQYQWSLDNNTYGYLNKRTGDTVIYTSLYSPPVSNFPVIQVVTVTSSFSDSSTGATNSGGTGTVHQASAYITHLAFEQ